MPDILMTTSGGLNPDDLFAIFDKPPQETNIQSNAYNKNNGIQPTSGTNDKGHQHRKTQSLVGFDPLLSDDVKDVSHNNEGAVWNSLDSNNNDDSSHPLSTTTTTTTIKKKGRHRTAHSVCASDLRDLASQLSQQRPRAMTKDEELEITLGVSASDSISKSDYKLLSKKMHRPSKSLADVSDLMRSLKGGKPPMAASPVTVNKQSKGGTPPRTPPRNSSSSRVTTTKTTTSPVLQPTIMIPTLNKPSPTSFLTTSMAVRTSEQEPSPHQVQISSPQDLESHAKLCALLQDYSKLDQHFDFNILKGVSRMELQGFVSSLESIGIPGLVEQHKPIVKALLECGGAIQVEGHVVSTSNKQLQVAVFFQEGVILVVFRGTDEQQLKPTKAKKAAVLLDDESKIQIYPPFRESYFELESLLYPLVDRLMEENPFSQVVTVGHSFGAALATIGAIRLASARPAQQFTCHAFASPKVGAAPGIGHYVHSLPNLCVERVELGGESSGPDNVAPTKYQHVGHTLAIHPSVVVGSKPPAQAVHAYRFDVKKPAPSLFARKPETDIQSYIKALEPFSSLELLWASEFVGEDVGKGVRGKNNEKRLMV